MCEPGHLLTLTCVLSLSPNAALPGGKHHPTLQVRIGGTGQTAQAESHSQPGQAGSLNPGRLAPGPVLSPLHPPAWEQVSAANTHRAWRWGAGGPSSRAWTLLPVSSSSGPAGCPETKPPPPPPPTPSATAGGSCIISILRRGNVGTPGTGDSPSWDRWVSRPERVPWATLPQGPAGNRDDIRAGTDQPGRPMAVRRDGQPGSLLQTRLAQRPASSARTDTALPPALRAC